MVLQAAVQAAEIAPATAKVVPFRSRVSTRPVAVIDDDLRYIRFIERALGSEGIRVQPVTTLDVDEVVRVVEQSGCGAALVDLFMYGSPLGFQVVERLRTFEATRDLPILMATGARRDIGRSVDFLQRNNCSVILKPFAIEDLIASVKSLPGCLDA